MSLQANLYAGPLILSAVLAVLLAALAWRRRPAPGAATMAVLMVALGTWAVAYTLELISVDLPAKLFWAKTQYISFLTIPALWLVFVLQYSGRERWLTPARAGLLAIMPVVTLALVWTTEAHGLIYDSATLDTSGPFTMLRQSYGPFFWVQGVYAYALFLVATTIVLLTFLFGPRVQRAQSAALLVGALVPLVGNALYVTRLSPVPNLDLAPTLFFVTAIAALWGLWRFRFLDLLPVARDALIEGMSDGVAVVDARSRVVDLNAAAQRLVGRQLDAVMGLAAADILPGWPGHGQELDRREEARMEVERPAGDGLSQYLELRVSPLYYKGDRFRGWLAVYRDVSDSRHAEQGERQQRALMDGLRDAAAALTSTLSLDEVLDRILEQTATVVPGTKRNIMLIEEGLAYVVRARGYSPEEMAGGVARLRLQVRETANLHWMMETRQPLAIEDTRTYEGWIQTFHFPWIRSYAGAPIISKGAVVGFLNLNATEPGFFNQGHARALQAFADQAGVAIENARLYTSLQDANARLSEALRVHDEALQNVSHELRTPLTIVLGYTEFLQSGQLGPLSTEQQDALRTVQQQGRRLVFMVNSLLMLQSVQQEELPLAPLELADWLPAAVEEWRYRVEGTNLALEVQLEEPLPVVLGATSYLDMVIGNLIDNAVKFSPNGGVIRVSARREGEQVVVAVADQGIGIPQEQMDLIFGRFYQGDGASTRRFRGMGIGLTLSQAIVAAHGGRIWAESPGTDQGTTVCFTLPVGH